MAKTFDAARAAEAQVTPTVPLRVSDSYAAAEHTASPPFVDCDEDRERSRSPTRELSEEAVRTRPTRRGAKTADSHDKKSRDPMSTENDSGLATTDTSQSSPSPMGQVPVTNKSSAWLASGSNTDTQPISNTAVAQGTMPTPAMIPPSQPKFGATGFPPTTIPIPAGQNLFESKALQTIAKRIDAGHNIDQVYYEEVTLLQEEMHSVMFTISAMQNVLAELQAKQLPRLFAQKPKLMSPKEFVNLLEDWLKLPDISKRVLATNKHSVPYSIWVTTPDASGDLRERIKHADGRVKEIFLIYDSPTKCKVQESQTRSCMNTLVKQFGFRKDQLVPVWPGPRGPKNPNGDGWSILSVEARKPFISCRYNHAELRCYVEVDTTILAGYQIDGEDLMKNWLKFCQPFYPMKATATVGPLAIWGKTKSLEHNNRWAVQFIGTTTRFS